MVSISNLIKNARRIHGTKYDYLDKPLQDGKLGIVCPQHGEFWQNRYNHLKGCGCPKCANDLIASKKLLGREVWIKRFTESHGDKYDYGNQSITSLSPITIICPHHGAFLQSAIEHANGAGCPKCAPNATWTLDEFISKCLEIHDSYYDYSKVKLTKITSKVTITCPKHGDFKQVARYHVEGHGCKLCGHSNISESKTVPFDIWVAECRKVHSAKYKYRCSSYTNAISDVEICCPKHGVFQQKAYSHRAGHGCPSCQTLISKPQQRVLDILDKHQITYSTNNRDVLMRKGTRGTSLELDILCGNLAIEVNGIMYHHEGVGKNIDYHLDKTLECMRLGIQLLHFWDSEIIDKFSIVEGIIKSKLGLNRRLFARKLILRELTKDEKKQFFNSNHLQGNDRCGVAYGLTTKKGRIACAMSFTKPRFNSNYQWEISRFACSIGITVVGGASRLLKAFEREYKPTSIISYADLRYSNGNLYKQLGLTLSHRSKPNYFYANGPYIVSRYQAQKHKLSKLLDVFDPELSEVANMNLNRYYRVFDCGNLVFTKEY